MPNNNTTFNPEILKNILPQLLQKVDLPSLLSMLKSKVNLSPDYYVGKTVNQLSSIRDQKLRVANMLDLTINFLQNADLSKFSPINGESAEKTKLNLSAEEVLGKTIEFLTTLKDYTSNLKNTNITDTIKNNLSKNGSNFNIEDYTNKLSEILEKLKGVNNN